MRENGHPHIVLLKCELVKFSSKAIWQCLCSHGEERKGTRGEEMRKDETRTLRTDDGSFYLRDDRNFSPFTLLYFIIRFNLNFCEIKESFPKLASKLYARGKTVTCYTVSFYWRLKLCGVLSQTSTPSRTNSQERKDLGVREGSSPS